MILSIKHALITLRLSVPLSLLVVIFFSYYVLNSPYCVYFLPGRLLCEISPFSSGCTTPKSCCSVFGPSPPKECTIILHIDATQQWMFAERMDGTFQQALLLQNSALESSTSFLELADQLRGHKRVKSDARELSTKLGQMSIQGRALSHEIGNLVIETSELFDSYLPVAFDSLVNRANTLLHAYNSHHRGRDGSDEAVSLATQETIDRFQDVIEKLEVLDSTLSGVVTHIQSYSSLCGETAGLARAIQIPIDREVSNYMLVKDNEEIISKKIPWWRFYSRWQSDKKTRDAQIMQTTRPWLIGFVSDVNQFKEDVANSRKRMQQFSIDVLSVIELLAERQTDLKADWVDKDLVKASLTSIRQANQFTKFVSHTLRSRAMELRVQSTPVHDASATRKQLQLE